MKHTGDSKEFSDWVQKNIIDHGHQVEINARQIAESIVGDELYPATYSEGKLSASCDGLTMDGSTAFEHKQWNTALRDAVINEALPDEYQPQCQQVMMVTGAKHLLFMVSDGTPTSCEHMWVKPDAKWVKRILQGWAQFAVDLAEYQHVEEAVPPTAATIESLPALLVQVEGRVLATNLDQFKQTALTFINNIKTDLSTDQDFADADKMTKFLKDGEDKLEAVKNQALAQTTSIYDLFRAIDYLSEEMRVKRLMLEKAVKTRKDSIRIEIQESGRAALREHIDNLNKRLGKPYMPDQQWADFAGVMKGKKTISSLRDAVETELARAKIAANEIADRIQVNMNSLRELATDHAFLFADTAQIVLKANDDLVALVKLRIAEHKEAEVQRLERERIQREQEMRMPHGSLASSSGVTPPLMVPPVAIPTTEQAMPAKLRPTDDEIVAVLALHYRVDEIDVIGWLLDMDLQVDGYEAFKDTSSARQA
jgi:predicted phage-related endonuclease